MSDPTGEEVGKKGNVARLLVYPAVVCVLAGLIYVGFVYEAEPDVATLVNSAEVLAQARVFDRAIENAERALRQDPDCRYAHIILGYCHGEEGRHEKAVEHYRRAVELPGENREALRLHLAEALLAAGRNAEGEKVAREVLVESPKTAGARFVVAKAMEADGRVDEALALLGEAHSIEPSADALMLMASFEEGRDRLPEALRLLDEAAVLSPELPGVLLRRARVHARMRNDDGAVADLLEVAERHLARARSFLATEEALAELRDDPRLIRAMQPEKK
jgi:tetratricopeptide (TPR) repeat protein